MKEPKDKVKYKAKKVKILVIIKLHHFPVSLFVVGAVIMAGAPFTSYFFIETFCAYTRIH